MNRLFRQKDKVLKRAKGKVTIVCRYGAIGDMIMITPVLRQLKKDGYYVVVNCHDNSKAMLVNNPNVDDYIIQKPDEVPQEQLEEYWEELSEGVDRFVNLSGIIEGELLKVEGAFEFKLPKTDRHMLCNKNYTDFTMQKAGYDIKGAKNELYFSKKEHEWARGVIRRLKGRFLVVWALSGSSVHKVYPYTEYVATEFLDAYPDTHIITVGDEFCKMIEWDHPRTWSWSNTIKVRKAMILTKYADLVVGTETGILNAASCFDTPKIILLSHSTKENLTKYWSNCESIEPNVHCYPCHQIHYTKESCPLNSSIKTPLCMTLIRPEQVLLRMEEFYKKAKREVA